MYIVYATQYLTQGDVKTILEYLETRSDKSISSNSPCDLTSIIFNIINSEFKCGYDTLMRVFVYGSKVIKI